jgi:hypothetical protein
MKTPTTMLASLAIAALATATLNSTEALAKSGAGGSGGMRSFSAAVRTPFVVNKIATTRTVTKQRSMPPGGVINVPPVPGKLTTTLGDQRNKPNPTTTDVGSPYHRLPDGSYLLKGDGKNTLSPQPLPSSLGDSISSVGKAVGSSLKQPAPLPSGLGQSVGDALGSSVHLPPKLPVATPLPAGTPPVVALPPKLPSPILTPPPAGTPPVVTLPGKLPPITPPSSPPIILPPPVVATPPTPPVVVTPPAPVSVGVGVVAATEVIDPPSCTYERSVRKLPGGGLQRVLIKVCPDVIVQ